MSETPLSLETVRVAVRAELKPVKSDLHSIRKVLQGDIEDPNDTGMKGAQQQHSQRIKTLESYLDTLSASGTR